MEEKIISYLQCPECSANLLIFKITGKKRIQSHVFIHNGLLQCYFCLSLFPIIQRIPWLVKRSELSSEEKQSVSILYYISRFSVMNELKKYDRVIIVFADFIKYSTMEDYHFNRGKLKKFLARHPVVRIIIVNILLFFKIEPIVYLFFIKRHNRTIQTEHLPESIKNE